MFRNLSAFMLLFPAVVLTSCGSDKLSSPDGEIEVEFGLVENGVPCYSVQFRGQDVIMPSTMGFELKDAQSLTDGFKVLNVTRDHVSEKWAPVWGENDTVLNEYNEMTVELLRATAG